MVVIRRDDNLGRIIVGSTGSFVFNVLLATVEEEEGDGVFQIVIRNQDDEIDRHVFDEITDENGDLFGTDNATTAVALNNLFTGGNPVRFDNISDAIDDFVSDGGVLPGALPFDPYVQIAQNLSPQISENTVTDLLDDEFEDYLVLTTPDLDQGDYFISVEYLWTYDNAGNDFIARTTLNDDVSDRAALITAHRQEPADSLGGGSTDEPIATAGSDQWHPYSYSRFIENMSGVNTFRLQHANTSGDIESTIIRAVMKIERIA